MEPECFPSFPRWQQWGAAGSESPPIEAQFGLVIRSQRPAEHPDKPIVSTS